MQKSIITFILLALSFSLNAQSDISTGLIARRVISVLNENHIKPRALNEELAKSIHKNIMSSLDDDKLFFTKENSAELESQLPNLVADLSGSKETYLDALKAIYNENLEKIKGFHKSYFESEIDLEKVIANKVDLNEAVSDSELQAKWNLMFRNTIIGGVIAKVKEQDYEGYSDSLSSFITESTSRVKEIYTDYFTNINSEISFVDNIYLNSIATSYDPHSNYFSFSQNKEFEEELSSERELFGVTYVKNIKGELEVHRIIPGSSAWLSGQIRVGDVIQSIKFGDEKTIDLKGKTRYQLNKLFEKTESDRLEVTLENENDGKRTVELLKTKVYSDDDIIKSALLNGEKKIGYISLPDFYTSWNDDGGLGCANDLAKTLIKLKKESIDGVILDLRDNGGGSLKEAIDLAGIFIDYGPVLVATGEEKPFTYKDFNRGSIYKGPMIVLINENSASASEVVAATLQDYNRAVIVGQPSFGKATGQAVFPLARDNNMPGIEMGGKWGFVKVTGMGLYRIDLRTNQVNGVVPDINLEVPYDYDPFREEDYPNVLNLDSIEKKMYYTALPEMDLASIESRSKERQLSADLFIKVKSFGEQIDALYDSVDYESMGLTESLALSKKVDALESELEKVYEEASSDFKSQSVQYDEEVYKMSEYLNRYKEAFHEEIDSDPELSEAYTIMLELINK
ncbi:MAG: carboxyl-terminal processing protease [Crocinitomicaceae bacterium]|jgi:carboxyl-terminal processing protease